jgi:hypothetical protein
MGRGKPPNALKGEIGRERRRRRRRFLGVNERCAITNTFFSVRPSEFYSDNLQWNTLYASLSIIRVIR